MHGHREAEGLSRHPLSFDFLVDTGDKSRIFHQIGEHCCCLAEMQTKMFQRNFLASHAPTKNRIFVVAFFAAADSVGVKRIVVAVNGRIAGLPRAALGTCRRWLKTFLLVAQLWHVFVGTAECLLYCSTGATRPNLNLFH